MSLPRNCHVKAKSNSATLFPSPQKTLREEPQDEKMPLPSRHKGQGWKLASLGFLKEKPWARDCLWEGGDHTLVTGFSRAGNVSHSSFYP